jgi:hypothetical protein
VVLPVAILFPGAAGGAGGQEAVRVDLHQREVVANEPRLPGLHPALLHHRVEERGEVAAGWALEVRELHDGYRCGRIPHRDPLHLGQLGRRESDLHRLRGGRVTAAELEDQHQTPTSATAPRIQ